MATKQSKPKDIKEIDDKISELKIELLKQPTKKKSIKRQIARLLTDKNKSGGKK